MLVPAPEWSSLLESWSRELLSATDRVHYLIGNRHQPTKGTYREMLLRRLLRRVLPDRFRVSTGFIYRWDGPPSRQIDVLIWDCQEHSALLEEGELAVLAAESVEAIVEVKSTLDRGELRDSLDLLDMAWLVYWSHTAESSATGLPQQVPDIPVRAVFAFDSQPGDVHEATRMVFAELAEYYRERFGEDVRRVLRHRDNSVWVNMIDAVCIARGPEIEQALVTIKCVNEESRHPVPGFLSCLGRSDFESISVGRFCMYLLWRLTGWKAAEAAKLTLRAPERLAVPGVCALPSISGKIESARVWALDVTPEQIWIPNPPLWHESNDEGAS